MKRILLIVAFMFSIYALPAAPQASAPAPKNADPALQIDAGQSMQKIQIEGNGIYDWGKVKAEQSPLKANIKIFNKGGRPLHITKVQPGCGCTTAPLDKENIEPGGFATLNVSLDIRNYTGEVTKSISISSDDPMKRDETLFIKANIIRPLTVFPRYFQFNELIIGKEGVAKVVVSNTLDKAITIKEVISTPDDIKVSVRPGDVIPAGGDLTITAKVTPKASERLQSKLVLRTDSSDAPELTISGWGNAIDPTEK
ncbi:MAG: DUF1573 domain-containing protein [Chloroflexota bacterium]